MPGGIFASPACEELFHRDDGGIPAEKGNCETCFCLLLTTVTSPTHVPGW